MWVRDVVYTDTYDLELCAKRANKTKKNAEKQKQQKQTTSNAAGTYERSVALIS